MAQNMLYHSKTMSEVVGKQLLVDYKNKHPGLPSSAFRENTPSFNSLSVSTKEKGSAGFKAASDSIIMKGQFDFNNFGDFRKSMLAKVDCDLILNSYSELRDILKDARSSLTIPATNKSSISEPEIKKDYLSTPERHLYGLSAKEENKLHMLKNLADYETVSQSQNTEQAIELEESMEETNLTESIAITQSTKGGNQQTSSMPMAIYDYSSPILKTELKALKHSATTTLDKSQTPKIQYNVLKSPISPTTENADLRIMLEAIMHQMERNAKETAELREAVKSVPKEIVPAPKRDFSDIQKIEKLKDLESFDWKNNENDANIISNPAPVSRNMREEIDLAERKVQELQTQRLILKIKQLSTKLAELKMQLGKNDEQINKLKMLMQNNLCVGRVLFSNEINIEQEALDSERNVDLKIVDKIVEKDFEEKFVSANYVSITVQDEVFDPKVSIDIKLDLVKEILRIEIPHFPNNKNSGFLIIMQETVKERKSRDPENDEDDDDYDEEEEVLKTKCYIILTKDEIELNKWEDAFFSMQVRKMIKKLASSPTARIKLLTRDIQTKVGSIVAEFFDESLSIQREFSNYDRVMYPKKVQPKTKKKKISQENIIEQEIMDSDYQEPRDQKKGQKKREMASYCQKEKKLSTSLERTPTSYAVNKGNNQKNNLKTRKSSFGHKKSFQDDFLKDSEDIENNFDSLRLDSKRNLKEFSSQNRDIFNSPRSSKIIVEEYSPKDKSPRDRVTSNKKKQQFALSVFPADTPRDFTSVREKNNVNFFTQTSIRCKEKENKGDKDPNTQLTRAEKILQNGFLFLKYEKVGKPLEKLVYLSQKEQDGDSPKELILEWKEINKKRDDFIEISLISDVLDGKQSQNFKRFKSKELTEIHCFTLVCGQKNIDFEANDIESKLKFLSSIKILIENSRSENKQNSDYRSQQSSMEKGCNSRKTKSKDNKD